mmetsp:Transcript_48959/g.116420  ORF Transcript_48959/g.116420 Transcript_48959/m.116420 type:complete len:92 (+) Transcript_48959:1391-1666(+)
MLWLDDRSSSSEVDDDRSSEELVLESGKSEVEEFEAVCAPRDAALCFVEFNAVSGLCHSLFAVVLPGASGNGVVDDVEFAFNSLACTEVLL